MKSHGQHSSAGFTLIELMVVTGLIVLLIGGFSAAFSQNWDHALRHAQLQVASLIDRARLAAISQQSNARLVIDASDSDHFMRVLQVFVLDATGTWNAASPAVQLSRGICIVPPLGVAGSIDLGVNFSAWRSVLAVDLAPCLAGEEFEGATRTLYLEYAANGTLRNPAPNGSTIAIAAITGNPGQAVVADSSVRLLTLLPNGAVTLEATAYPP